MPPTKRCLTCRALHNERGPRCRPCYLQQQQGRNAKRGHYQGDYRVRRQQLIQQGMMTDTPCAICGQAINYGAPAGTPLAPTADHINAGDPTSPLRIAHARCNSARGDRPA